MTRRERPDLGWHAAGWGILRRWWERRRTPDGWDDVGEMGESTPATPEPASPHPAPRRWMRTARTIAMWCAGALLATLAVRPAPWVLAVLLGCASAGLVLVRRTRRTEAERLAHELEREQHTRTARAVRAARQRQNRTAHQAAQDERDEAARRDREARRAANREQHWRQYPYAD